MAFNLVDDGTLDTVLRCEGCGQESRYNGLDFDSPDCEAIKPGGVCLCFARFIVWAKADAEEQHVCLPARPPSPEDWERERTAARLAVLTDAWTELTVTFQQMISRREPYDIIVANMDGLIDKYGRAIEEVR